LPLELRIEQVARELEAVRAELIRTQEDMEELNRIGAALSGERDLGSLLEMILEKARWITSADAGSLYLVDETVEGTRSLRFRVTQNNSSTFPFQEFTMPLSETSMAGYVAIHGEVIEVEDAYKLTKAASNRPYQFNPAYDQSTGYRTRSMLTLPMKNAKAKVIGVLQLINCKRDRGMQLKLTEVHAFPPRAVRLAHSLASQAAVAYENSQLYQNVGALFEGFVKASVTAIEQRDPTTSGHSLRVAKMTEGLAEVVDRVNIGPYAQARFTPDQIKELRYAALLHDFGKVAVREEVLIKAKKLYPFHLTILQHRFDYVRKTLERDYAHKKLAVVLARGLEGQEEFSRLDEDLHQEQIQLDEYLRFILEVNEPTVLRAGQFGRLIEIARKTYLNPAGDEQALLTPEEVRSLSISQGSLDEDERRQIESHVMHSFNFLMQIPWTSQMRGIPLIARGHHEKLNGTGYPDHLRSDQIPVQAKMMTICDIFDALSASDRPYKKAVPVDRALDILKMSVRDKELDADLFQMFVEAHIFLLI